MNQQPGMVLPCYLPAKDPGSNQDLIKMVSYLKILTYCQIGIIILDIVLLSQFGSLWLLFNVLAVWLAYRQFDRCQMLIYIIFCTMDMFGSASMLYTVLKSPAFRHSSKGIGFYYFIAKLIFYIVAIVISCKAYSLFTDLFNGGQGIGT